jgi:pimeloyl-ACP methyl ester carboxylesterase
MLRSRPPSRGIDVEKLSITVIPSREHVHLMEGRGHLEALYFRQRHPAPLLFIVPGAGSQTYDWPSRFLSDRFHARGYHVVLLPGTMTWNFALAASGSGLPGIKEQDARDLRRVMTVALEQIKQDHGAEITRIGFLGISMGGLDGAYVSDLETREHAIGISRFLLVNPPVDLFYAGRVVDQLYDEGQNWSKEEKDVLLGKAIEAFLEFYRERRTPEDGSFLFDLQLRLPLTDAQRRFLIGYDLKHLVGDVVYVSQLIRDRGVLKVSGRRGTRSARVAEASAFSVHEYIERLLLPEYAERTGTLTSFDDLARRSSLRSLPLDSQRSVYIMHNADDFLVTASDLAFLQQALGGRLKLYPRGGHVGNVWYPENVAAILATFDSM